MLQHASDPFPPRALTTDFSLDFVSKQVLGWALVQILLLVLGMSPLTWAGSRSVMRIEVDPRTELLSVIFHLAGSPEYGKTVLPGYARSIEGYFGRYRQHPAVTLARQLRATRGVGYAAPMNLAVHVQDITSMHVKEAEAPWPDTLDERWHSAQTERLLALSLDFAEVTDFDRFCQSQEALYRDAVTKLQALLDRQGSLDWFDGFFGPRPHTEFRVIITPTNGTNNYAAHVREGDKMIYYCFLGVYQIDRRTGRAWFDSRVLSTVVHEFCHAYCNPILEANWPALREAGERLYFPVHEKMVEQAYGSWQAMLIESLVRACTVRYQQQTKGPLAAEREIAAHTRRGFLWIRELAALLGAYELQREQYATLAAYSPEIIRFFDQMQTQAD